MVRQDRLMRRFLGALDYLVDGRVGLIKRLEERSREPDAPHFYHFYAQAGDIGRFNPQANFVYSGGAGVDRDRGMAKAVGEGVERYCGAVYDRTELPLTSYNEAGFDCVHPDEFALFSQAQYDRPDFVYVKFTPETKIRWVEGLEPLTGRAVHVPACMVYIPYDWRANDGDSPVAMPITTGLAAHMGLAEAALTGVLEVIERDAFTITWQARVSPPQILLETLSDRNYEIVERFERLGDRVTIFNITLDHGVTTVLSVMRSDLPRMPAFCAAASADTDPEKAVRASLEELAHTRRYAHLIKQRMPITDLTDYEKVVNESTHVNFWARQEMAPELDFLFASDQRVEFDDLTDLTAPSAREELLTVCRRIEAVGHRTVLVDVTTEDVRDLGFAVVKAVVPGFHPLSMGFVYRALGGRRLWEVPQKMGYPGVNRETGDNPLPHPYP